MRILVSFLFAFFPFFMIAENVDSLKNLLKDPKQNDKQIIYLKLIEFSNEDSLQKIINYADEATKYAIKNLDDTTIAQFYNQLGVKFYFKGYYSLSDKYFQLSADKETQNGNLKNAAMMYSNVAVTYEQRTNYQKALEFYNKALAEFTKLNYEKGKSKVYNNIGIVYQELGIEEQALEYFNKALKIKILLKDFEGIASTYNNIGVLYEEFGKNNDSALFYYNKALSIYDSLKNEQYYSVTLQNISAILLTSGQYSLAIEQFLKVENIFLKINNKQGLAWTYRNLAQTFLLFGKIDKVENYLLKSIKLAHELNDKQTLLENLKIYSDYYFDKKDYFKSVEKLRKYVELYDSVKSIENQKQIEVLNKQFETSLLENRITTLDNENELKEKQIKQHRMLNYLLLTLILMILIATIFVRMYIQSKNKQKQAELEQKILRLQMNPHFLSNALVSAQSFVLENKNYEAVDYISDLSNLMRQTIKATTVNLISIAEEIAICENYLKVQQKRLFDVFDFSFDIDSSIDIESFQIPPMLIQPFLENSIKHGFKNIDYKGKIELKLTKDNNSIYISVIDNGIGIIEGVDNKTDSYTVQITEQRLIQISKKYKKPTHFEINMLEKGVEVKMMFPLDL